MKKVLLVLVMMVGMLSANVAQSAVKIAHINVQELAPLMPQYQAGLTALQDYQKQLETQYEMMMTDYQSLTNEYQASSATWSDFVKETKAKAIGDAETRIQEFEQSAPTRLREKEAALMEPIFKAAKDAIDAVAKANGYTYVFDTSSGTLLTYPEGDDLLPLVKKHLGII